MAIATKGHEEIAKAKGRRTASTARAPFAVMLRAKNLTTISGMSRPFMGLPPEATDRASEVIEHKVSVSVGRMRHD